MAIFVLRNVHQGLFIICDCEGEDDLQEGVHIFHQPKSRKRGISFSHPHLEWLFFKLKFATFIYKIYDLYCDGYYI